ncbi:MAG: diaminopimelate decarboxylase family protein, partial [Acidimicrobiales bacterium]
MDGRGRLSIGGVDLVDLAEEHGTPLFVYDEAHLRSRCREAVAAFGDGVAYASKAFLCAAMARLAHQEGMALDVASEGEVHVALAAGVPASRLVLHGNNKSVAELRRARTEGVGCTVVDSSDEIRRLEVLHGEDGRRPRVMVRVTPGVEVHTHQFVMTGQEDSKFGFSVASGAAARAVEHLGASPAVELVGVHAHIGSQVFALSSFDRAVGVLAGFFGPLGLGELCVGGGLGVAYVTGEEAPTISAWATGIRAACRAAGVPDGARVTAE